MRQLLSLENYVGTDFVDDLVLDCKTEKTGEGDKSRHLDMPEVNVKKRLKILFSDD